MHPLSFSQNFSKPGCVRLLLILPTSEPLHSPRRPTEVDMA